MSKWTKAKWRKELLILLIIICCTVILTWIVWGRLIHNV